MNWRIEKGRFEHQKIYFKRKNPPTDLIELNEKNSSVLTRRVESSWLVQTFIVLSLYYKYSSLYYTMKFWNLKFKQSKLLQHRFEYQWLIQKFSTKLKNWWNFDVQLLFLSSLNAAAWKYKAIKDCYWQ